MAIFRIQVVKHEGVGTGERDLMRMLQALWSVEVTQLIGLANLITLRTELITANGR